MTLPSGELNVVLDALSRLFGEVEEEPLPQEPTLVSSCRNVLSDRPYRAPGPRDFQVSSQNLDGVDIVHIDRFARAVSLFPLLDPEKLLVEQRAELGPYIEYVKAPATVAVPDGDNKSSMSHYFMNENVLFRLYLPGYLRKRSSFRDQLVVPTTVHKLVIHSCHDLPPSGGHLASKATFDIIRYRYWWRTMLLVAYHVERRSQPH